MLVLARFVVRCLSSLFFLFVVMVLTSLVTALLLAMAGREVTVYLLAIITSVVSSALVPGIMVLCVARGDTRWERWRAKMMILLPAAVLSFIWVMNSDSWTGDGQLYQPSTSGLLNGVMHGLIYSSIAFPCALLTALSLPSLKHRAFGRPPGLVWLAMALMLVPLLVKGVSLAATLDSSVDLDPSRRLSYLVDMEFYGYFVKTGFGIRLLIELGLLVTVAMRGSPVGRALLAAYYFVGAVEVLSALFRPELGPTGSTPIALLIMAISGTGLALFYYGEVDQWFTGGASGRRTPGPQRSPAMRRTA